MLGRDALPASVNELETMRHLYFVPVPFLNAGKFTCSFADHFFFSSFWAANASIVH